jgi:hypothetical protein
MIEQVLHGDRLLAIIVPRDFCDPEQRYLESRTLVAPAEAAP